MDASASLCSLLDSMVEIKKPVKKSLLLEFVMGIESDSICKAGFEQLETFGCGSDQQDKELYKKIIEKALAEKLMKDKDSKLAITARGKKFLLSPVTFMVTSDDDEDADPDDVDAPANVPEEKVDDELMEMLNESGASMEPSTVKRSTKRIHLIQAIDRKFALDDFAEQEGMSFDELMEELEGIIESGTRLNIRYFGEEVIGEEDLEELLDFLESVKGNVVRLEEEYGDVYKPEELRLAHLIWQTRF